MQIRVWVVSSEMKLMVKVLPFEVEIGMGTF